MDPGNINPIQHLPWWLRETSKRILISLVGTGIWTRNSLNTSPVWWIWIGAMLCAFKNLITDRTSQSAGAGIRTPSSTAATMLLWELGKGLLVHVLCDVITLSHGCANHDTEGKRFKSPIYCCDVMKPPYLISSELCTSPLHCLCTPCAVGAPSSASLCSEHINRT